MINKERMELWIQALESADPMITINGYRTGIVNQNDDAGHSFWTIAQAMRAEFLKEES